MCSSSCFLWGLLEHPLINTNNYGLELAQLGRMPLGPNLKTYVTLSRIFPLPSRRVSP
jgi:hypothetical protein